MRSFLSLLAFLWLVLPAAAQSGGKQPTYYLSLGASFPTGPSWFTEEYLVGAGGTLLIGIPINAQTELVPGIGVYAFFIDETAILDGSSGSLSGGTLMVVPVTLGLKVNFAPKEPVGEYVFFGGGYYAMRFQDLDVTSRGRTATASIEGRNNAGVHVGAGLAFRASSGSVVGLEANYHTMLLTEPIGEEGNFVHFFALKLMATLGSWD